MLISKQRGISMPMILLVLVVAVVAIRTGMALVPMFVDDTMVKQILQTIVSNEELDGKSTNRDIRRLLEERLRFNNINVSIDTLEIERTRDRLTLSWPYERRDNVMANIDLVARFQHEVVFDR
ncbi:hypothetical protein CHH28_11145 [Bacterioplanes sanyensis]|uniref:DUF4845 domain-containing protein n=1 Tax=Bacterioplanes sanyensis TaxID=1249553 RepID=A0A222FKC2_9GAMM|nr:DUF4845 domain-containing protein [Bacterioplanes sanyensis]ASP39199.1 hypothetical protein CHH28_11145 [Bacterioplanes sanyensis]